MKKEHEKRKKSLTVLKDWIAEEDLRSCLALIVTVGGLIVIAIRPEIATPVIGLIMVVLTFYFATKDREQ